MATRSIEMLVARVEALEDYEESSNALLEVLHLDPAVCARLALNMLSSGAGDVHLRSLAFCMLYRADRSRAFEHVRQCAPSCDSEVFATMLDEVSDDVGLLNESQELQKIVEFLRGIILVRGRSPSGLMAKAIEQFARLYKLPFPS